MRALVVLLLLTIQFTASFVSNRRWNFLYLKSRLSLIDQRFDENLKFAVTGGGAFSLALATVLANKNISSVLLVRNESVAQSINLYRYHPKYLSNYSLSSRISATTNTKVLLDQDYIIHAVPMQSSREYLQSVKNLISSRTPILSVSKGVEQGTFALMNQIILDVLGPQQKAAFLSGPSFAQEIMNRQATAVVIASTDLNLATELSELLSSVEFRCHTSSDVKGVELGGAIKNVIALAAGMCEGLGLGMNAMSSLVTRGCREMASMGQLLGAEERTFYGLAGVGDAFGTCLGPLSRNRLSKIVRRVGFRLAKGENLEEILQSLDGVSEGVYTVLALEQLLKTKVREDVYDFKFPIVSGVAKIVKGEYTPAIGLEKLMKYPLYAESVYFKK